MDSGSSRRYAAGPIREMTGIGTDETWCQFSFHLESFDTTHRGYLEINEISFLKSEFLSSVVCVTLLLTLSFK
jgi:hypothetical protein